jgi:hypothetical protein
MPRPPGPDQRRYRGTPRAQMRSAIRHLANLQNRHARYLTYPIDHYPNQLYQTADGVAIDACVDKLEQLLDAKGPIPSRTP